MAGSTQKDKAGSEPETTDRVRMALFVTGEERNSQAARMNLARFCENYLAGRVDLEIIDVLENHRKALEWRVLLTPVLLVFNSERPTRITGTLQDPEPVLAAVGLHGSEPVL